MLDENSINGEPRVGERRPAPRRQRLAQRAGGTRRLDGVRRVHETLQPVTVSLLTVKPQDVPRHAGKNDRAAAERSWQLRHAHVQRGAPRLRGVRPRNPSRTRSDETTFFALNPRIASSARCFAPPSGTTASPSATSSGPRIRNSISLADR